MINPRTYSRHNENDVKNLFCNWRRFTTCPWCWPHNQTDIFCHLLLYYYVVPNISPDLEAYFFWRKYLTLLYMYVYVHAAQCLSQTCNNYTDQWIGLMDIQAFHVAHTSCILTSALMRNTNTLMRKSLDQTSGFTSCSFHDISVRKRQGVWIQDKAGPDQLQMLTPVH